VWDWLSVQKDQIKQFYEIRPKVEYRIGNFLEYYIFFLLRNQQQQKVNPYALCLSVQPDISLCLVAKLYIYWWIDHQSQKFAFIIKYNWNNNELLRKQQTLQNVNHACSRRKRPPYSFLLLMSQHKTCNMFSI